MSEAPVDVVVVEDDPLLRQQLSEVVDAQEDFSLLQAFESAEVLLEAEGIEPAICLVDLGLPGMSGIELIGVIRERWPEAEVLAHTVRDDRKTVFAALTAGAAGYLAKGGTPDSVVGALRELRDGGAPMSPHIARAVIGEFQRRGRVEEQFTLSARERDVLKHIEQGLTYREVADTLHISPHTVHAHIKNIYEKLHARNKKDALVKARMRGII